MRSASCATINWIGKASRDELKKKTDLSDSKVEEEQGPTRARVCVCQSKVREREGRSEREEEKVAIE